ncbi:MAG: peptidase S41, partial [Paludibacteraceae bacterium]|nr:peptidase S41 [Paludibacteraceae bacterium]
MPDVFVPLDTTSFSDYYQNIIAKGVLNKTIAKYFLENEKMLRRNYKNIEDFASDYRVEESLLCNLKKNAQAAGIEFEQSQYDRSKSMIENLIKAIIARDLWDSSAYFQVMNEQDQMLIKSIEILQNGEVDMYMNR